VSDVAALSVGGLRTYLPIGERSTYPVDGLSFSLAKGETLAIVGESGSGKSMTAASIIRLLPTKLARVIEGEVLLDGHDLMKASESQMQRVRGAKIALMPQDPMTALNPSLTIGYQVSEPLLLHERLTRDTAYARSADLLTRLGIPDSRAMLRAYPHQLSGGMRQRAVLAMALICGPKVLIADEPTTAVDVTTQEQIIDLLQSLQRESGLSLLLITHDMGVVARIADAVLVMYAGRAAEYGLTREVFYRPVHPYTRGLLDSIDYQDYKPREHLKSIAGVAPRMDALPTGCAFHVRCPYVRDICREAGPTLGPIPGVATLAACHPAQAGELEPWHPGPTRKP
jgi:oligopeptide/dipeptide ABC transporter ATP-binding protein